MKRVIVIAAALALLCLGSLAHADAEIIWPAPSEEHHWDWDGMSGGYGSIVQRYDYFTAYDIYDPGRPPDPDIPGDYGVPPSCRRSVVASRFGFQSLLGRNIAPGSVFLCFLPIASCNGYIGAPFPWYTWNIADPSCSLVWSSPSRSYESGHVARVDISGIVSGMLGASPPFTGAWFGFYGTGDIRRGAWAEAAWVEVVPVPEPSSLIALGALLTPLLALRRRRARHYPEI